MATNNIEWFKNVCTKTVHKVYNSNWIPKLPRYGVLHVGMARMSQNNFLKGEVYNFPQNKFYLILPTDRNEDKQMKMYCKVRGFHGSVTMKKPVFWDVSPCRYFVNRRFGVTYRLHLQGTKIRERKTSVSRWLQISWNLTHISVIIKRHKDTVRFPLVVEFSSLANIRSSVQSEGDFGFKIGKISCDVSYKLFFTMYA
jgi:hypothetical protein